MGRLTNRSDADGDEAEELIDKGSPFSTELWSDDDANGPDDDPLAEKDEGDDD